MTTRSGSTLITTCRRTGIRLLLLITLVVLGTSADAQTGVLTKFDIGKIEFQLSATGANSYAAQLHPKGGIASLSKDFTATVFAISGPSRLVIDIPGISFGVDKKSPVKDSVIERVRVGSHPDKTRFVVDMANEVHPEYEVRTDIESESIVISFVVSPGSSNSAAPMIEKHSRLAQTNTGVSPAEPIATAKEDTREATKKSTTSTPSRPTESTSTSADDSLKNADALLLEAIRKAQKKDSDDASPSIEDVPEPEDHVLLDTQAEVPKDSAAIIEDTSAQIRANQRGASEQDPSGKAEVSAILFKRSAASNAASVVFQMKNPGTYQLVPQGNNRYELQLPNSKLGGNHLVLPQFPPEDFKEFDVIMARQTGDSVVVKIFISKGVKLYPAKIDNDIWLKTEE